MDGRLCRRTGRDHGAYCAYHAEIEEVDRQRACIERHAASLIGASGDTVLRLLP